MSLATLALVVLSWGKKAPVPAPEPSVLQTFPGMTLLAVCVCWLLPLVLLRLTATPKHDLALERANALMARINASELRSTLNAALLAIAERTAPEERCIILSGGVDTCAILTAAKQVGVTFAGAITVLTGADAPDAEFAVADDRTLVTELRRPAHRRGDDQRVAQRHAIEGGQVLHARRQVRLQQVRRRHRDLSHSDLDRKSV